MKEFTAKIVPYCTTASGILLVLLSQNIASFVSLGPNALRALPILLHVGVFYASLGTVLATSSKAGDDSSSGMAMVVASSLASSWLVFATVFPWLAWPGSVSATVINATRYLLGLLPGALLFLMGAGQSRLLTERVSSAFSLSLVLLLFLASTKSEFAITYLGVTVASALPLFLFGKLLEHG